MELLVKSEHRKGYVYLSAEGEIAKSHPAMLGHSVRTECHKYSESFAIVDCRGVTGALTVTELYSTTPEFIRAIGKGIRVAYVPPVHWNSVDDSYSRDVAKEKGGTMEAFASVPEAERWIYSFNIE